ncbi:MAG: histidine kinase [Bryobacteraceae bacterium]|jgi:signal transduction histidine kinase
MTPAAANPPPAAALCEMLLRQSPGCAWLLKRDGTFQAAYGDTPRVFGCAAAELHSLSLVDLIEPLARTSWTRRLERLFTGETLGAACRFAGRGAFSVTMFPIRTKSGEIAFAGGMAHDMPEADLLLHTLEALESDRARLPQLLHDHVGQSLSAAGLQLDLLRMELGESALPIPQRIGEIQALLDNVMALVRDVNRELNPAVAERAGLRAALDRLAGRLRTDFGGNVRVFADATAQLPPEAAAALYRIAQEAAGRASRRAGCSAIEILLKSLRSGPALEIRDNGPGLDAADWAFRGGGLELLVMQHFADRAGIELQIESSPAKGTLVRALCRAVAGQAAPPAGPPGTPTD